jgi:hypothetical protein
MPAAIPTGNSVPYTLKAEFMAAGIVRTEHHRLVRDQQPGAHRWQTPIMPELAGTDKIELKIRQVGVGTEEGYSTANPA